MEAVVANGDVEAPPIAPLPNGDSDLGTAPLPKGNVVDEADDPNGEGDGFWPNGDEAFAEVPNGDAAGGAPLAGCPNGDWPDARGPFGELVVCWPSTLSSFALLSHSLPL